MALDLVANLTLAASGLVTDLANAASQPAAVGQGVLPAVINNYTYGTGNYQVNSFYAAARTLAGLTYDPISLTTDVKALGNTFALTKLKLLLIGITSPDGAKKLRVGPQNQPNAAQLWWGGTGATVYEECATYFLHESPFAGDAVGVGLGTGDVLPVYNPTAGAITYGIWILGLN